MHRYRTLSVWRKSHQLALFVYRSTGGFRPEHRSLAVRLRCAAHSVPANIAQGSGRATNRQFAQQLQLATASARELDYLLKLAGDLGDLTSKQHATLEARTDEVTRMLVALRKVLEKAKG